MLNAQITQLLDVHVQIPRFSVGYRMALIWKHVCVVTERELPRFQVVRAILGRQLRHSEHI